MNCELNKEPPLTMYTDDKFLESASKQAKEGTHFFYHSTSRHFATKNKKITTHAVPQDTYLLLPMKNYQLSLINK